MKYQCYIAGECEPFLMTTKSCYERLMEAILRTGSRVAGSFSTSGYDHGRSGSFIISVDIPDGKEPEFQRIAKCSLQRHPDLCFGYEVAKSVKSYVIDEPEKP